MPGVSVSFVSTCKSSPTHPTTHLPTHPNTAPITPPTCGSCSPASSMVMALRIATALVGASPCSNDSLISLAVMALSLNTSMLQLRSVLFAMLTAAAARQVARSTGGGCVGRPVGGECSSTHWRFGVLQCARQEASADRGRKAACPKHRLQLQAAEATKCLINWNKTSPKQSQSKCTQRTSSRAPLHLLLRWGGNRPRCTLRTQPRLAQPTPAQRSQVVLGTPPTFTRRPGESAARGARRSLLSQLPPSLAELLATHSSGCRGLDVYLDAV